MSGVGCPRCGWVNPWTDSGDRGLARADHDRTCKPGPATPELPEPGTRIELVRTSDQYTNLRPGDRGTVVGGRVIPGFGTLWVKWDSGSNLGLIVDEDVWRVVER